MIAHIVENSWWLEVEKGGSSELNTYIEEVGHKSLFLVIASDILNKLSSAVEDMHSMGIELFSKQ